MIGKTFALSVAAASVAVTPAADAQDRGVNVELIAAGDGVVHPLPAAAAIRGQPVATWALSGWFKPDTAIAGGTSLVRLTDEAGTILAELSGGDGAVVTRVGTTSVTGRAALTPGRWTFVAVTVASGRARLTVGGRLVAEGATPTPIGTAPTSLAIATREAGRAGFTGRIASLDWRAGGGPASVGKPPEDALVTFVPNSPTWAVQRKQQLGQEAPQPPETLPVSRAPFSAPRVRPLPRVAALAPLGAGRWAVNGWQLAAVPDLPKGIDGAALSGLAAPAGRWYAATVPGTVLTTLVDRGVYPDPAFGLNNMAIPEVLNRQDYWYRSAFTVPASAPGKRLFLRFDGVNYAAEVWLNGRRLGDMRGAFIRGRFDVTGLLRPGERAVVAVKVAPAPHPGLPHEESLTAGAGENGGMMVIDGPTFVASEGWDWIPSVRDRNTGMWQGVGLEESGDVRIGDVQVVTSLPRPDNSIADLRLEVPVENLSDRPVTATVAARFDDVAVSREVVLAARERRTVAFAPADYPQLSVRNPRLWWPNGYGVAALHDLTMTASVGGTVADGRSVRFGMRTVTYETSLVDGGGRLRRLAIDPTRARETGQAIVDATHEGIRQVRGGWAPSLAPGAEGSPAIRDIIGDDALAPNLVIRVNGVRIAARGGNWGMDDFMKRVERSRLEPFFRLHRDAHLNIIRNWVGQNTEDNFFDLADEYGMLVFNDFWESTQNYNQQADDTALFMTNATDVVMRFRHHPSIVAWIGRNEGVPQPALNAALQRLIGEEDGTRLYLPSSNRINLAVSGPYEWREPEVYFTRNGKGFAIEVGTPSFPTLESWKRSMAPADLWPISDAWAYHDWHQDKGGAVGTYMAAIRTRFGEATNLEDFEKRAQMLQFDSYRAIFEGMNAGLWKTNSGRMLWMTQAAWPSSAWNIYSSDYDAQASYYAVKSASEPVHVQMNLPDRRVVLVNNTVTPLSGVTVRATVVDLAGGTLVSGQARVDAPAVAVTAVSPVADGALARTEAAIVRLEAVDARGTVLSRNSYWQAGTPSGLQAMTTMAQVPLTVTARQTREGGETVVTVDVTNGAAAPAVETKLTLFDRKGAQVLPAYYDDNYLTLLPGERRVVAVRVPGDALATGAQVAVRGWNVVPTRVTARP